MKKQLEKLKEIIGKSDALVYKEDNHYYLLFPNQTRYDGVLIEQLKPDTIVVWCYDIPNYSEDNAIKTIVSCFDCKIIIPYIEDNSLLFHLLDIGFKKFDFSDELVDEDIKEYPSVILEKGEKT